MIADGIATARMKAAGRAALLAGCLAAAPALAQVPSMMGAPGLSPVPSEPATGVAAPAPAVVAPPAMAAPSTSGASSCETDMLKYTQRRNAAIAQINAMVKGGKKKLDPSAACPRFRHLVAVETEMKNWVIKNKDWCSIPDQMIEGMKQGFARTPVVANQACNAAAMVAKMKSQAAQQSQARAPAQPSIKLPSGPL